MTEAKASYHRILRSTSIIGGASFINIAIGVLRTKVLAVLLGPAGVGLTRLVLGNNAPCLRRRAGCVVTAVGSGRVCAG